MFKAYKSIVNNLNTKFGINLDDKNLLVTCSKISNGYSFKIGGNYTPVTIESNKSITRLFVKASLFNKVNVDFSIRNQHVLKSKSDYIAVDFGLNEDLSEFVYPYLDYAINNYTPSKSFGCCGRYIECSDAKKCVHPNQIHAKQCYYRNNLEMGKIFYGKNKNI